MNTTANERIGDGAAAKPRLRLDFIDALRGLACVWVILHHSFEHHSVPAGFWHLPLKLLVLLSNIGWLGVSLFLVLSGFCLFYPLARKSPLPEITLDIRQFAHRRMRRILPPYYAALLLFIPLAMHRHELLLPRDWLDVAVHFLMLFNLKPFWFQSIDGAFWSLALECQLYVLFPLLVFLMRRQGMGWTLGLTLLVSLSWQLFVFHRLGFSLYWAPTYGTWYHALPGRCFEFAAGMTAAALVARPAKDQGRHALTLGLILLVPALYFVLKISRFGPLCDQVWGTIFACALVFLAGRARGHTPTPRLRGLVWLGTFSYSIYLVHGPLLGLLALIPQRLHIRLAGAGDFAFGLLRVPVIVAVGYLFFLVFEEPFLVQRKNETPAEVARDAALSPAP